MRRAQPDERWKTERCASKGIERVIVFETKHWRRPGYLACEAAFEQRRWEVALGHRNGLKKGVSNDYTETALRRE